MRIERIATRQGHPVPDTAHSPKGPFPPELFETPKVVTEYLPQPDGGGEEIPVGATAQNDFKPLKWFRCKICTEVIAEHEISDHPCKE